MTRLATLIAAPALALAFLIVSTTRTAFADRQMPRVRIVPGGAAVLYHVHTTNSADGSRYNDVGLGLDLAIQPVLPLDRDSALHGLVFIDGVAAYDAVDDEAVTGYFAGAGLGFSHFGESASFSFSFWVGSARIGEHDNEDLPPVGLEMRVGLRNGLDLAVRAGKVLDEIGIMAVGSLSVGYAFSM